MDEAPPDCVIASSNRCNDIFPYSLALWKADPKTWGSILPWDFPQNASKEQEEAFIRKYFTDQEIHMQGGAHGPGNGFRFLKQVWYCIAIDNYERRIPAVADWWRDQDSKGEQLLQDESTKNWLGSNEAKPPALFGPAERELYGDNFLQWVVKYIQAQIKKSTESPASHTDAEKPERAQ